MLNWNLKEVKQMVRQEIDADTIMRKTGIKREPLRRIVICLNERDQCFYRVDGLFGATPQSDMDG